MKKWLYVVCFWGCGISVCANPIKVGVPGSYCVHQDEIISLWRHCSVLVSCEKNKNISINYEVSPLCLQSLTHPLSMRCAQRMLDQRSLSYLEEVWRFFLLNYVPANHTEEDEIFFKEFGVILLCLYEQILLTYLPSNKVAISEVLSLSSQIASLPLDRVVDALNACYDRLKVILGRYAPKPGMSLSAWVQMYWWVPPVVLLSSLYSVVAQLLFRQAVGNFFSATHMPHPSVPGSDDGQGTDDGQGAEGAL